MTFPVRYTVQHLPADGETEDDDGNTVPGFGTAVPLPAYVVAPHTADKSLGETELDTWDVDVFMPKAAVSVEDRMVFDGVTYDVAKVDDWTYGLTDWKPGIVVGLKKWQG